jgi:hypothetical protein
MSLTFRMGEPAHGGVGDRKPTTTDFLPDDVPHPDDREPNGLRDGQDFLFPAARHSGDADDAHGWRGIEQPS